MENKPGTYALILKGHTRTKISVGRWGELIIKPGYYIYVGSAFGPGGVKARVLRHCRESKSVHWHIDYLRQHIEPVCVWYYFGRRELEHRWATAFSCWEGIKPIERFGSSDCDCVAHLFSAKVQPCLSQFSKVMRQDIQLFTLDRS